MDRKEKREYSNVFSFIDLLIFIMKQVLLYENINRCGAWY